MTIQMKAIEHYFHVVLFIMLYKVVLTFTSLGEPLVCGHSNDAIQINWTAQYLQGGFHS